MKLTTNLLKDPRTLAITMAASAFLLAAMAIYQTSTTKTQRIAVADMQSIMDAQKLVWVQKMRLGEKTQVIASSREFQQKIEGVLTDLTVNSNTVIFDKNALVAGSDVTDITPIIMERLSLSISETQKLRQTLEDEIFSDFPTMRKDLP